MSNLVDGLTAGIMFIVFAFGVLISLVVFNSISSTGLTGSYDASFRGFYDSMNYVSIFIMLGMSFGAVMAAYMIRAHPIFFAIAVLLVFIQFIIFPPLINAFNALVSGYTTEGNSLSLMIWLVERLPLFTAVASLLAAIIGIMQQGM